jgi:hypothetical protein
MNVLDEFREDAERVLDRLVDGELPPRERQQLLAALDDEPGGWRRCALAFLEAQAWRWQMTRLATEPLLPRVQVATATATPNPRRSWGWLLAAAASLAGAFLLGTRYSATTVAGDPAPAKAPPEQTLADTAPQAAGADARPWRTLSVKPVGAADDTDPLVLRVMNGDDQTPRALSSLVGRGLEQDGWDVERRQALVPIDLSDGRRVLVPVEQVDLESPAVVSF